MNEDLKTFVVYCYDSWIKYSFFLFFEIVVSQKIMVLFQGCWWNDTLCERQTFSFIVPSADCGDKRACLYASLTRASFQSKQSNYGRGGERFHLIYSYYSIIEQKCRGYDRRVYRSIRHGNQRSNDCFSFVDQRRSRSIRIERQPMLRCKNLLV